MSKKVKILVALVVLLALVGGGIFGYRYYNSTFIRINENRYRRDVTTLNLARTENVEIEKVAQLKNLQLLDLSGTYITVSQFDQLAQALPGCEIAWEVPFQGDYVNCNSTELTLDTLSDADMAMLKYLPGLKKVACGADMDPATVAALEAAYPGLEVDYDITLGGQVIDPEAAELTLTGVDIAEVQQKLKYLPKVTYVEFTEELDFDALIGLVEAYPEVTFQFPMDFVGKKVHFLDTFIDISNTPLQSVEEVERLANLMPRLEKVDMIDCGISNEEMGALNDRNDRTLFVWMVDLSVHHRIRTDSDQFMPVKKGFWLNDEELYNLRYCTEIVGLDLGHHLMTNIDFVQYMPKLRYLIIADSKITDITPVTGLKNLIFFEMFGSQVKDYTPLLSLTGLEDLNLSYTRGDPEIIAKMTWLKRLWWRDFPGFSCDANDIAMLKEALPNVEMRFDAGSSTGEGWRDGYLYFEMRDFFGMYYMTE